MLNADVGFVIRSYHDVIEIFLTTIQQLVVRKNDVVINNIYLPNVRPIFIHDLCVSYNKNQHKFTIYIDEVKYLEFLQPISHESHVDLYFSNGYTIFEFLFICN